MSIDYRQPDDWSLKTIGIRYVTKEPISWAIGHKDSAIRLDIPGGRGFDVSIPRGLRWLLDPHDPRYRIAGLVHDELLHEYGWTRMRAGGEFHDALRAGGTPPLRALAMWLAVSVFRYPGVT